MNHKEQESSIVEFPKRARKEHKSNIEQLNIRNNEDDHWILYQHIRL